MAQTLQAEFHQGHDQHRVDYTPSGSAVINGEVVTLGDGTVGICTSPEGIADGSLGSLATRGIFRMKKDGTDTFALGVKVAWDTDANQVEPDGGANDDFSVGTCVLAAVATDDFVLTDINRMPNS